MRLFAYDIADAGILDHAYSSDLTLGQNYIRGHHNIMVAATTPAIVANVDAPITAATAPRVSAFSLSCARKYSSSTSNGTR